ncbi:Gp15 family bacteriophage protein [Anaerococcus vaginimassiliensis]|uniref:Gp15 family bacteriophage protein n=1 Tax=Anaerococcus vaginimassiliensis TaxID=2042308 RepID=UPI00102F4FE9|nr:Gp15 family bacteriophage protein [Anaerococcus vaginimassiliensis]
MSYLTKELPNYVDVGGERIAIKTDFRTWIKYEELMLDKSQDSEKQVIEVLNLCLAEDVSISSLDDLEKLFDALLQFYSLGEKIDEGRKKEEGEEEDSDFSKPKKIYSYEHDWSYIYSAYMECYNINLFTDHLHWWEFKALFNGLSDKCLFSKIMSFRSMKITSKMSKDEKKFYRQMKKIYALPDERTEEEKEISFARSMMASMQI